MLFVVYLKPQETWKSDTSPCLLATFLMRCYAESFVEEHSLKGELVIAEVDDVWDSWMTIKDKLEESL